MSAQLAAAGPSLTWYLTRATGAVALLLLTVSLILGILDARRANTQRWPRFVVDSLHQNVALLSIVFLGLHVLTSILDSFTSISLVDAFVPFTGSYRPFWLGLGAIALDLLLAVAITSGLRRRLGYAAWRATHWASYACWPIALLHGFGTGSDVKATWLLLLSIACVLAVLAAVLWRALTNPPERTRERMLAIGLAAAFSLFLVVWLPAGPLGRGWARRAGTPTSLLKGATGTSGGSGQ